MWDKELMATGCVERLRTSLALRKNVEVRCTVVLIVDF